MLETSQTSGLGPLTKPPIQGGASLGEKICESFVKQLPMDGALGTEPRQVEEAYGSFVTLEGAPPKPKLICWSKPLAKVLGLEDHCSHQGDLALLSAQADPMRARPYAQNYGGFQFGQWAGQLGDGRAVNLGDLVTPRGERFELQLKGSGLTPYSRQGDGKAVLRSSIREFLASEALFHLEVPTTRALSLMTTGEGVYRDQFHDGRGSYEPGAVVCRVAPSFLRFGTFDLPASRKDYALVQRLADVAVERHFPQLLDLSRQLTDGANQYVGMFGQIVERTAEMIALWQSIGFVHGVMNTDNMSLLGLTLDYGPFGFMEQFDPNYTPNTSDLPGRRYCYGRQFAVGRWNLEVLAESLSVLMPQPAAVAMLEHYQRHFVSCWHEILKRKFGFAVIGQAEQALANQWYKLLEVQNLDINERHRALAEGLRDEDPSRFLKGVAEPAPWQEWWQSFNTLMDKNKVALGERLCQVNPRVILRNALLYRVAQECEAGDDRLLHHVHEMIRRPFDDWRDEEELLRSSQEWAQDPRISLNSCSS